MSNKQFYIKKTNYFVVTTFLVLFLTSFQLSAQEKITVKGTVIDESGLTIPSVNIIEQGTNNSVSTDLQGKYSIKVASEKSKLVFSFIGYESQTVLVGKKKDIGVVLKESSNKLEEVVVVGYGTTKKSDLTGSVASVSGNDLKKINSASVIETLTGRVAGVQVSSTEGSPDATINLKVRGGGSILGDGAPLFIVDGFPVNSLNDISPSDIDNISVLKDASSTAIYGSRGAYGVVIVTTKSGSKGGGKITVSYNTFYGSKKVSKFIDVLNPQDFARWQYEYAMLKSDLPSYENYFGTWQPNQYAGVAGTNWQKEVFGRTGSTQNNDLNINGGTDKLNFNFNYTRYNEEAIMLGSSFDRNNISLNLKSKLNDKIDLSFTMRYANTQVNGAGANEKNEISSTDSRMQHVIGYSPIDLPGITTDNTDEALSSYLVNPLIAIADNDRLQKRKNYNMLGGFSWKIIKNLQFKSDFGLDNYNYYDNRFYGRSTYYANNIPSAENQKLPSTVVARREDVKFRNANTLNYDLKDVIGKKHSLKLLVGEETIDYQSTTNTTTIQGFPKFFTFESATNLSSLGKPLSVINFVNPEDKMLSFFGRVNYDFKNRYLFTFTYRADGSSKFKGNNRWGYFPSAAAAWKISEESFLKDISWLKLLKLRASYGQAGNNDIPTGLQIQNFQPLISTWINGVPNYFAPSNIMANPDLKWETAVTQNLGLDYELFKGRVSGSIETYFNKTVDQLLPLPVSGSGYTTQYKNVGEVQNKGIEASLNVVAIDKKDYGLNFAFNINFNKNRINSLGPLDSYNAPSGWASTQIGADYSVMVGQPFGQMYGYQSDGRYEISDFNYSGGFYTLKPGVPSASTIVGTIRPGTMKLKDINGDGVVDVKDQTVIGNAQPKHTGGFVINARAYGFDLLASFNWTFGNNIYNANKIQQSTSASISQYRNLSTVQEDGTRWTNIDQSTGQLVTDPTALATLNANTTMWSPFMTRYVFSDWAVEDGSFLRLNTLSLGYTFPKELSSRISASNIRLYVTANNVFVLTKYSGQDPEVSTRTNTPFTPGVDFSAYPRSRQIAFGLNLKF
jgi:TonB-linked SusC/RagA family outer membrane protein